MQNDMLKNTIAPWQEKGRWYHAKLTTNGVNADATDQYLIDNVTFNPSNGNIALNEKSKTIIDYIVKLNNYTTVNTRSFQKSFAFGSNGAMYVTTMAWANFTSVDADIWLYII